MADYLDELLFRVNAGTNLMYLLNELEKYRGLKHGDCIFYHHGHRVTRCNLPASMVGYIWASWYSSLYMQASNERCQYFHCCHVSSRLIRLDVYVIGGRCTGGMKRFLKALGLWQGALNPKYPVGELFSFLTCFLGPWASFSFCAVCWLSFLPWSLVIVLNHLHFRHCLSSSSSAWTHQSKAVIISFSLPIWYSTLVVPVLFPYYFCIVFDVTACEILSTIAYDDMQSQMWDWDSFYHYSLTIIIICQRMMFTWLLRCIETYSPQLFHLHR